jgi:hypothetical protein
MRAAWQAAGGNERGARSRGQGAGLLFRSPTEVLAAHLNQPREPSGESCRVGDDVFSSRIGEDSHSPRQVSLRTNLAAGAFGDHEESHELLVGIAFVTFGNVARDRGGCRLDLAAEASIRTALEEGVNLSRQLNSLLPDLKLFECVTHEIEDAPPILSSCPLLLAPCSRSFSLLLSPFSPRAARRYCAVPRMTSPGSRRAARRAGTRLATITMITAVLVAAT